jgi:spermidine/putrescine transport system ATP-binding protein
LNQTHFPNEKGLLLKGIHKSFDDVDALSDVTLEVKAGEFFTLLGPSGCGKTTLLRIIAGLELPDKGRISLGGRDITALPAAKRQINTVFQNYALFPHLNVFENVAFGLKARKFPAQEVDKRVRRRLEMLGIEKTIRRMPHQLSGGQKQRVALARALVNEPEILLLDEPMSALDAKLRAQVQLELRRLQRKLGQTFILVTHDQAEALVVSDRLAVMQDGQIIQSGTTEAVYDNPQNRFVAEFLGTANLISARAQGTGAHTDFGFLCLERQPPWQEGLLAIRPEWIRIVPNQPEKNGVKAKVTEIIYRGFDLDIRFEPGPLRVKASTYSHFKIGDEVWLELPPEELVILND